MLKTSDKNQKKLTVPASDEVGKVMDIWSIVAVILERKVAIVVIFRYWVAALSLSFDRNCGNASRFIINIPP